MRIDIFFAAALSLLLFACDEEKTTVPDEGITSKASLARIAQEQGMSEAEVAEIFEACLDKGGKPMLGGFGQPACEVSNEDAGKSCSRDSDCEGFCLAESKTCAPKSPMFGCHKVLPDGREATICVD